MNSTPNRKIAFLAVAALLASASALVIPGCKNSNGSGGFSSLGDAVNNLGSAVSGNSSSGSTASSSSGSSGSSGNGLVDAAAGFMPNGTGGYLMAVSKELSAVNLSPKDEDDIGQSVVVAATSKNPISADQALNDYVTMVGYVVACGSARPDAKFCFGVLDTDEVNAFSGPNGYIMITRGAIAKMQDEAELAGVLGHEIAHVCNEDGLAAVKNQRQSEAISQAAHTAAQNNDREALLGAFADATVDGLLVKPYDRDQEDHADHDSVLYVSAVGYDPASYQHFVDRIAGLEGNTSSLFSTHPGFADRAKKVAATVASTGKSGTGATNRDRFQAATVALR